jgi:hypothetical protein
MIDGDTTGPACAEASTMYSAFVNAQPGNLKRITFRQEGLPSETLWAEKNGENTYLLKNAPMFLEDVGYGDIVTVKVDEFNSNILLFDEVIESADHVAIVAIGPFHLPEMQKGLKAFEAMGCVVEQWQGFLAVISSPKDADYPDVVSAFGTEKPPLIFVAPPGPWLVDVVVKMATGDKDGAFEIIEEVRDEFFELFDDEQCHEPEAVAVA